MNRAMRRKLMIEQLQKKVNINKPVKMNEEQRALYNEFVRLMKLDMIDADEDADYEGIEDIDIDEELRKLGEKSLELFGEA